jgi:hypothetical protein
VVNRMKSWSRPAGEGRRVRVLPIRVRLLVSCTLLSGG